MSLFMDVHGVSCLEDKELLQRPANGPVSASHLVFFPSLAVVRVLLPLTRCRFSIGIKLIPFELSSVEVRFRIRLDICPLHPPPTVAPRPHPHTSTLSLMEILIFWLWFAAPLLC